MPLKNTIKGNKCIVYYKQIPEDRVGNTVTCKKDCSRVYERIYHYVRSNIIGKYIIENKRLKKELKVIKSGS